MHFIEKRFINYIRDNISCFFILLTTVFSLAIRYKGRKFVSNDMKIYLLKWYEEINRNGGLEGLSQQVGDYGLLYQTIISLFTYIDFNPVYLYKMLSITFDYLLAIAIAYFVATYDECESFKIGNFCVAYAVVLFLPTVVWNSSVWGQCDSIYTFFLICSIWFLYKGNYRFSFFTLGCSLAFKLQSVIILPLYIFIYFQRMNFSLMNFGITLATFWASGILAYYNGRNLLDCFRIYMFQIGEHKAMWIALASFWAIGGNSYTTLRFYAIVLTMIILGIYLYLIIKKNIEFNTFESVLKFAVLVEWTCMLFLPEMHERYTYVLDLLLIMISILNYKYLKYAFVSVVLSIITYNQYLFQGMGINYLCVLIYLFAWGHYLYNTFINIEKSDVLV